MACGMGHRISSKGGGYSLLESSGNCRAFLLTLLLLFWIKTHRKGGGKVRILPTLVYAPHKVGAVNYFENSDMLSCPVPLREVIHVVVIQI